MQKQAVKDARRPRNMIVTTWREGNDRAGAIQEEGEAILVTKRIRNLTWRHLERRLRSTGLIPTSLTMKGHYGEKITYTLYHDGKLQSNTPSDPKPE